MLSYSQSIINFSSLCRFSCSIWNAQTTFHIKKWYTDSNVEVRAHLES